MSVPEIVVHERAWTRYTCTIYGHSEYGCTSRTPYPAFWKTGLRTPGSCISYFISILSRQWAARLVRNPVPMYAEHQTSYVSWAKSFLHSCASLVKKVWPKIAIAYRMSTRDSYVGLFDSEFLPLWLIGTPVNNINIMRGILNLYYAVLLCILP